MGCDICLPSDSLFASGPAPLNRIKNKLSPRIVPAATPPGISRAEEVSFRYQIVSVLNDK